MDGHAGGSGGIDRCPKKELDSDSGVVDVVSGDGARNLIGAGGSRKDKGINLQKREAADKRKARQDLPPQDDIPLEPLRVFPDGSRLRFDWRRLHPTLLSFIICQVTDICWALVIGRILEFMYNKDRGDISLHKELDVEGFAKKVKLGCKGHEPGKKAGSSSMAIGSVKVAMDYALSEGIEKKPDTQGRKPKTFALKGSFHLEKNANAQTIIQLMETKGPVGLTLDFTNGLLNVRDGIYRVPKPIDGLKRHVVAILAHGLTSGGEVFFEVQNTWGTDWGVNGYGRIIITGTTDDIFYLDKILDK